MRLTLEPIQPEHAPEVQYLASDPTIGETSNLPSPYPEDGARTWIHGTTWLRERGEEHAFAIMDGDRLVGVCGLKGVDAVAGTAEVGYWIGKPYWGKGYASKCTRLLIAFGFRDLNLLRLNSRCLLNNRPSFRVLEKSGFHLVAVRVGGEPKWPNFPVAFFQLGREMWAAGNQDLQAHNDNYP